MKIRMLLLLVIPILIATGCGEAPESRLTGPTLLQSTHTCELEVPLVDALAEIAAMRAEIDALEASGALSSGQANALRNHLDNAQRLLDAGHVCPALAQLRAFREQVGNFVEDGVLTEPEAAPLLEGADTVLDGPPPVVIVRGTIDGGGDHTCGLTETGQAYCWGANGSGQLGDGTRIDQTVPAAVSGGISFTSIAAGDAHTCGLDLGGAAYCWGNGVHGNLGDGSGTTRDTPVPVSGGHTYISITAGSNGTCGLRTDGAAYCWGRNNVGQLGDGTTTSRSTPTSVIGDHSFTSIRTGGIHTCAVRTDGAAYCWGTGTSGRLGDGTTSNRHVPTAVAGGHLFATIAVGTSHSCGVRTDGAAYCWGANVAGAIGDGTTDERHVPVAVDGGHTFVFLEGGQAHTCGIRTDGSAYCWGLNASGELGDGTLSATSLVPTPVSGGFTFTHFGGGRHHTCGIDASGTAYCWGLNRFGQIGDGTITNRNSPTAVSGWSALP